MVRRKQMRVLAMPTKARKCSALRSYRRCRRRHPFSQDMVRSITQRRRPRRPAVSFPRRAIRGTI
jgi:hypothetical protein